MPLPMVIGVENQHGPQGIMTDKELNI